MRWLDVPHPGDTEDPRDLLASWWEALPVAEGCSCLSCSLANTSDIKCSTPFPSVGTQQHSQGRIPARPCRAR